MDEANILGMLKLNPIAIKNIDNPNKQCVYPTINTSYKVLPSNIVIPIILNDKAKTRLIQYKKTF